MTLVPGDPLAHRALESLLRAEANVRRRLSADLEREGLSATGSSVLVVLTTAGGELELRALRARLRTSKANATEVVTTLEARGLVVRRRLTSDRRAASVALTFLGQELVDRLFPEHTQRVAATFSVLHETEKRSFPQICRKLPARCRRPRRHPEISRARAAGCGGQRGRSWRRCSCSPPPRARPRARCSSATAPG